MPLSPCNGTSMSAGDDPTRKAKRSRRSVRFSPDVNLRVCVRHDLPASPLHVTDGEIYASKRRAKDLSRLHRRLRSKTTQKTAFRPAVASAGVGIPTEDPAPKPTPPRVTPPPAVPTNKPKDEPFKVSTAGPPEDPAEDPTRKPTEEPTRKLTEEPTKQPMPAYDVGEVVRREILGDSLRGMEHLTEAAVGRRRRLTKNEAIQATLGLQEQLVRRSRSAPRSDDKHSTGDCNSTGDRRKNKRKRKRQSALGGAERGELAALYRSKAREALAYALRVGGEDAKVAVEILAKDVPIPHR